MSVATISGFTPPSRFSKASRMCRESRGVPGTTIRPDPRDLVVDGVEPGDAALEPEVLRRRGGVDGAHRHLEAQPVHGGEQSVTPVTHDRDVGLGSDEPRVRRGDGVGAQVVLVDVHEPGPGQCLVAGVHHRRQADVARLGHQ
nr:hypothetical protein GCM10010200_100590 [Actinomadura rugatobispora]